MGPTASLDAVAKRKSPCRGSNPGRPARSLVTIMTEATPAPYLLMLVA
jgi:hypothetical protein